MKNHDRTALPCLLLIAVASHAEAVTILNSADGSGMSQYRFGLTDGGVTAVDGTAENRQQVSGDPVNSFSDLYGPNFISLSSLGITPGDSVSFSYDIYLPAGLVGITGSNAQFRFYNDANTSGTLQFGAGSEFANRRELFGTGFDLATRGAWQTVSLNGTVPLTDMAGGDITHFEYAIQAPQSTEPNNDGGNPDGNGFVEPASFWIRNINVASVPARLRASGRSRCAGFSPSQALGARTGSR